MSSTTTGDLAALDVGAIPAATEVLAPTVGNTIAEASARFAAAMAGVDGDAIMDEVETSAERARDDQGRFVSATPDESDEEEAEPDATGEPAEVVAEETAPAEEAAPIEPITLLDRNGKEVVVEVSDPEIAEVIRAAKNDGMRKAEFTRRIEAVQTKEQEFRAFEVMLQTTPELVVERMSPDIKIRTLQYLLASNFDDVAPLIAQWYGDKGTPEHTTRREALLGMKENLSAAQRTAQSQMAEGNRIAAVQFQIESLIPETASPEDAQDFYTAAAAHLGAVDAQRGNTLRPEEVAPLLERFRARFGFTSPTVPAAATPPSLLPVSPSPAAPVGDKAQAIAKRATATAQRMKALPAQQAAAAKVAPQGAGAAPAVRPPAKSWDEAGVNFAARLGEQMTQASR
jgi:hypothetical protein